MVELCALLGVPRPDPSQPETELNEYVFERAVTFRNPDGSTSPGRIDLYKRSCFVMEAKQGADAVDPEAGKLIARPRKRSKGVGQRGTKAWDDAMLAARGQAEQYAKALPAEHGWPPFLVVVDVGHVIELFADFSGTGKAYVPFPDSRGFKIALKDLADEAIRDRLTRLWTDPLSLDPSRHAAKVTRDVAERLARLAKSLEAAGHHPKSVAQFLMRCLFTMFAEDVDLIPKASFRDLLKSLKGQTNKFPPLAKALWQVMNSGGYSPVLKEHLLCFNGGLFENADALALTDEQLDLLTDASSFDWKEVEPAIFGTLLERALDPEERHKLGAHYTPRAYVERLVIPAVIEPLREDWAAAKAAAVSLARQDKLEEARAETRKFHLRLCETRVLDPACGSGNFLYVTLEHMKRLEGEVAALLEQLGEDQAYLQLSSHTVDPHQFLGIEINPRAAEIAEIVLWIGFLQWHFRARSKTQPPQPVLKKFKNIEHRDAVLVWDRTEIVRGPDGKPLTRWDGKTTKKHPVTGEDVPDETARVEVERYIKPRPATWPAAEFIVGNPPFIGNKRMRLVLGDGYVDALRAAYSALPESIDYVVYWWDHAARLVREGKARRFGLIATNSLRQTFNRKVTRSHLGTRGVAA